jgi:5-methylcytosine-specific restriction endonuclease McrA
MTQSRRRRRRRTKRKQQYRINRSLKKQIIEQKKEYNCCYCGISFPIGQTQMTVEHIVALCLGGTNDLSNIDLACRECNQAKGKEDWKKRRKMNKENYGK